MSETRVIHVNDMPRHPDAIYIGRRMNRRGLAQSPFANPFPVEAAATRAELLDKYRAWLADNPALYARLPELRGKPLACWCRHEGDEARATNACHGDVLVELLETHSDDELRVMAVGTALRMVKR